MSTEVPAVPSRGRPFTRADLESLPDDGRRYELLDGVLVVSPAPRVSHQIASARLFTMLQDAAAPAGLLALYAPVDVALADDTASATRPSRSPSRSL
ncbi:Uma2 family endonuclease [Aeromicrobium sp. Leaf350]|uniref:Uma2 family endonuclease n=1 Tax=Aeromicrobium sp. Leaf350 TaxID=2876565 RepID=UPI001E61A6EE|nr:Uma2 family endonuclease [Aeromicrobium sp. Leaf350]